MYVILKQCGQREYIDYYHNKRFGLEISAINELNKMFQEQLEKGSEPKWLVKDKQFHYKFNNKSIFAKIVQVAK